MIQKEVLRGFGLGLCVEIFGGAHMFVPEVEEFDMGVCVDWAVPGCLSGGGEAVMTESGRRQKSAATTTPRNTPHIRITTIQESHIAGIIGLVNSVKGGCVDLLP